MDLQLKRMCLPTSAVWIERKFFSFSSSHVTLSCLELCSLLLYRHSMLFSKRHAGSTFAIQLVLHYGK